MWCMCSLLWNKQYDGVAASTDLKDGLDRTAVRPAGIKKQLDIDTTICRHTNTQNTQAQTQFW